MNSHDLQGAYAAALSRIGTSPVPRAVRKYTPIFHRDGAAVRKQAVKDAANALGALWGRRIGKE